MLDTSSPQTERLVLLWHDYFATDYYGIDRWSYAVARQLRTFREHGTTSYRILLKEMLRDPGLLNYLDASSNRREAPNENLARELLELFVLGEGNYDETTIREAARSLTGRSVNGVRQLQYANRLAQHDTGEKSLFGRTGNFDGDDLIDILLEQPSAARHLAGRFWHAYVSDNPPDEKTLESFADVLRGSDYDIATLYRAILESEAFWAEEHRASIVKNPVQLVVGLARTLEYPSCHWLRMPGWLERLGMELFAPPNVGGWDEGIALASPGRLLTRHQVVRQLARACNADDIPVGTMSMSTDQTTSADPVAMPDRRSSAKSDAVSRTDTSDQAVADGAAVDPTVIRVAAVRIRWVSSSKTSGLHTLVLGLEDVRTPSRTIRDLTLYLQERADGRIELRLKNDSCWPDCLRIWPRCSSAHPQDPNALTVRFPLDDGQPTDSVLACQYRTLTEQDRQLVDSLRQHVVELFEHATPGERAHRFESMYRWWRERLKALPPGPELASLSFDRTPPLVRSSPREVSTSLAVEPPSRASASIEELVESLRGFGVVLDDLLAPGVALSVVDRPRLSGAEAARRQLDAWFAYPAFQVL